jgi:hypothetical protein
LDLSAASVSSPYIVGSILFGADEFVSNHVASRIQHMHAPFGPCTALGIVRGGNLVGGVVYHGYVGHDIQVSIALDRTAFLPWRALFAYPFEQLGCSRLTAFTGRKNKKARKLLENLGFNLEGVHLRGLDGTSDAMSYGMLKENCRWIKGHGKKYASRPAAA